MGLQFQTTGDAPPLKILVIPDGHAEPGTNNDRWQALGNYVMETRPDVIVNLGDMADMPSLSFYDTKKSEFHSRRYREDIAAVNDAIARFHEPLDAYNKTMSIWKKKRYKPRLVFCMGNHENRINRALDQNRVQLEGLISTDDIKLAERGWEVFPFMSPALINGVTFQHYFPGGIMGKPIGGANAARSHTMKLMRSSASGHSHEFDYFINTAMDGTKVHGLVGGCFFDHTHEFAAAQEHLYWRGFNVLHDVQDGEYDLESIRLSRLMRDYM